MQQVGLLLSSHVDLYQSSPCTSRHCPCVHSHTTTVAVSRLAALQEQWGAWPALWRPHASEQGTPEALGTLSSAVCRTQNRAPTSLGTASSFLTG